MSQEIRSISKVSDGILVEFDEGLNCYYSTQFLLDHRHVGSNTVFLDHDPSPSAQGPSASGSGDLPAVESHRANQLWPSAAILT